MIGVPTGALLLYISTLAGHPWPAHAQAVQPSDVYSILNVKFPVPETPAFAVLGITPATITKPGSPQEFGTALLNGIDENGNLQSGLAIDFTPFLLFAGDTLTLGRYRTDTVSRALARVQVSLATTKASSDDDKAVRVGAGLRWTIWDAGDLRMEGVGPTASDPNAETIDKCYNDVVTLPDPISPRDPDRSKKIAEWQVKVLPGIRKAVEECQDKARERNWGKFAWDVAFAPAFISKSGSYDSLSGDGFAIASTASYGFQDFGLLASKLLLVGTVQYRSREVVPIDGGNESFYRRDYWLGGAKLVLGDPKSFFFAGEAAYLDVDARGRPDGSYMRYGLSTEIRIPETDLWLSLGLTKTSGRDDNKDDTSILGRIKWNLGKKSKISDQLETSVAGMK